MSKDKSITKADEKQIDAALEAPAFGDAALDAEMKAAAPIASAPPQNPARPDNRFMAAFPDVIFKTIDAAKTNTNNDGSRSKRVAAFCALHACGAFGVNGNIYAKLERGAKKVTAECSFVGNRSTQALVALDESAKAEMGAFRRYVAEEYSKWRNGQPTTIRVSKIAVELDGLNAEEVFAE
jgi:hypothetical protein